MVERSLVVMIRLCVVGPYIKENLMIWKDNDLDPTFIPTDFWAFVILSLAVTLNILPGSNNKFIISSVWPLKL